MSYTPQENLSITSNIGINSDTVISGGNWSGNTYTGAGELNDYAYVGANLQVDESGTLFFDFSQDGTNWSTYPVNGFTIASGINEVHTAWKGGRYMRPRFVGTGGRTFFRLKTYYSNLPLPLSAPLNQSIGDDQDATVVRAISVGSEPDGTYSNERIDGEVFKTTTPLSGTGVYTSSLFSTHGFSQIETRIYSDQPGTLVGRWYSDVGKTQLVRTFTRPYQGGEVGDISYFSAPVFGDYLEYEYTNGSVAQTGFDLELHARTKAISGQILGVNDFIPDSVVANLGRNVIVGQDRAGNFKNVGIDARGDLNVTVMNPQTAFGELRIAEMTPVIQVTFPYNINPLLVDTTTVNGASVTQADNMAVLTTSGTTGSMAEMKTVNVAKYRAGEGVAARFTAIFTSGATTTDSYQVIGIGDETDGYLFGYSGSTFGIHHRINSGTTFYAQSEWNIDTMDGDSDLANPSGILLDTTKGNVFEIQFQWLGYGAILFSIENPISGKLTPVHQIRYANANTVPSSYNPTFPIYVEVENGTSTDVLTLKTPSLSAFVEGKNVPTGPLQSASGSNTAGANGELLALRNVSVFPTGTTTTNKVVAFLRDLSISNDGANNTIVRVQLVENPVYSVEPTYTNIDGDTSIIEVGAGGTYTAGTGKVIATFGVTEVGNVFVDLTSRNIALRPGKVLALITQGDSSTETIADISWVEDF